eukprot:9496215-Pyramimonas_sp.AAC.1
MQPLVTDRCPAFGLPTFGLDSRVLRAAAYRCVCIRPSVEMETAAGSNEDDITMKLMQIIEVNNVLRTGLEKGLAIVNFMEQWDFLQCQCAMYINRSALELSVPLE